MDDKIVAILTLLYALVVACPGCGLSGRKVTLAVENLPISAKPLHDPFLEQSFEFFSPPPLAGTPAPPASSAPPEPVEPIESEPEEDTFRASISEQEIVLGKDIWLRNVLLDRYLENGMKAPFAGTKSSPDRRRWAQFDRLNLSSKEMAKRDSRGTAEYLDGLPSTWRWFHREMEQLASVPVEERANPEVFLKSPKYAGKNSKTIRANAAILMGRDGDPGVTDELMAVVAEKSHRTELRCAAVETLGKLPNVSADDLLPLLTRFKEKETEITNPQTGVATKKSEPGIPELWQETLYALAEKIEPWEHPCFLEPFSSKVYATRWSAAKLWRMRSKKATLPSGARLPEAFLEHVRQEGGEMVRIELVRTLGTWKTPNLLELIGPDLHRTAALRGAALDALAEADCREALPMIRQRLRDLEGANRAQAVAALRKLGCYDDVFKMARDTDTKVRMEVAKAFADRRDERSIALAKTYLAENDARLHTATLDAVSAWPIEQQGVLLLEAARGPIPKIRSRAVGALASHGVEVEGFDPVEQPKTQTAKHEELSRLFQKFVSGRKPTSGMVSADMTSVETDQFETFAEKSKISPDDPILRDVRRCLDDWRSSASPTDRRSIRDRLTSLGDRLPAYVQYLYETERRNIPASLDPVLAEVDPVFEAILRLDSDRAAEVRRGASELRRTATDSLHGHGIESLGVQRILNRAQRLVERQTDAAVLTTLLETLKKADSEAAKKLAESLLDAESAELRQKACATLGELGAELGDETDLDRLVGLLDDPSPLVFRSALEAVLAIVDAVEFDAELDEIEESLRSRLMQPDLGLQIDAAAALHRLGCPDGTDSLRRLAASRDNGTRIYVAKTVAALEDPVFLPLLFLYLDDRNGSVRKAALDALPKIAGEDVGRIDFDQAYSPEQSITQQRVDRWKAWYAAHGGPERSAAQ